MPEEKEQQLDLDAVIRGLDLLGAVPSHAGNLLFEAAAAILDMLEVLGTQPTTSRTPNGLLSIWNTVKFSLNMIQQT